MVVGFDRMEVYESRVVVNCTTSRVILCFRVPIRPGSVQVLVERDLLGLVSGTIVCLHQVALSVAGETEQTYVHSPRW